MNEKTKGLIVGGVVLVVAMVFFGLFYGGASFQPETRETEKNKETAAGPVPGKVTMIDLGADECVPCKMMAPILKELRQAYDGRAEIIFIDVWKDRSQASKYGIRAIPTQIFFNEQGEEVLRHTGFMNREAIIQNLSQLGVAPPEPHPNS
jgi:thioredoxin 1